MIVCECMNWHAFKICQIIFLAYPIVNFRKPSCTYLKWLDARIVAPPFQFL